MRAKALFAGFVSLLVVGLSAIAAASPPQDPAPQEQTNENQPTPHLKVTSNLVVVRVVVRDAQGKPVEGLQKEDFKLFDRGKEQTIAQFEAGSSVATKTNSAEAASQGQVQALPPSPALPGKFLALYFDDLNTSETDMAYARDAAGRYLSANVQPQDRVAIFTSEKMLTDFTSDSKQIRDALAKLHSSPQALNAGAMNCPDLTDYQAIQITQNPNNQNTDAWKLAIDEAGHCQGSSQPLMPSSAESPSPASIKGGGASADQQFILSTVLQVAWNVTNQVEVLARSNLRQIEQVVQYISKMPGSRSVILISPGFLAKGDQVTLDRIIDHALRSQVVVSSLDPKGLAMLMQESDASQKYLPPATGGVLSAAQRLDSAREFFATTVLAEVAAGTGGEFFHNNNDLKMGLDKLAGSPAYYILAFSPKGMRTDGKFHALTVVLSEKHKGFSVQARRGYFAPVNAAAAEAENKDREAAESEAQLREQLRETILSKTDISQFPVDLAIKVTDEQGGKAALSLSSHMDVQPLHFRKEGEHNFNALTFSFAVFDEKEKLVASQQREEKLDVLDGQLPDLRKAGVDANLTFHLKPGTYRVREVVADSEEHHMTALSREIDIPSIEKEKKAALLQWSPPQVDTPVAGVSQTPPCSLPDVLQLAARRAEAQVNDLQTFDARERIRYEVTDNVGMSEAFVSANFDYLVDFGKVSQEFKAHEVRQARAVTDKQHLSAIEDNGIPILALIFHPLLQADYQMRCEGFTHWNDKPAWVVYFHQIKDRPPRTAAIPVGKKVYPVSLKGLAWIATDSGQVLHLETNTVEGIALIEMQSSKIVHLKANSVSVDYAPVKFASGKGEVWLPESAVTYSEYENHRMIIEHTFSNFQLFSVQTQQVIQKPKNN
jgi:VWFA-related protein